MTRRKQQPSKHDSNNQDGLTVIGDKSFDALWSETLASMRRESPDELRAAGWRSTVELLSALGGLTTRQADKTLWASVGRGEFEQKSCVSGGRICNFWRPLKK